MTNLTHMTPSVTDESTPAVTHDSREINQFILLHGGYPVSKFFFDSIRRQVEEVLPALARGENYTTKILCGKDFWSQLGNGERILAGRCLADMVVRNILPLTFAHGKHEYPKRYQLK